MGNFAPVLKLFSGLLIGVLVLNLILLISGAITNALFWSIIVLCALFAYVILPWLRRVSREHTD